MEGTAAKQHLFPSPSQPPPSYDGKPSNVMSGHRSSGWSKSGKRRPEETDSDIAAAKVGTRINASNMQIFSEAQLHLLKLVAHSITLCAPPPQSLLSYPQQRRPEEMNTNDVGPPTMASNPVPGTGPPSLERRDEREKTRPGRCRAAGRWRWRRPIHYLRRRFPSPIPFWVRFHTTKEDHTEQLPISGSRILGTPYPLILISAEARMAKNGDQGFPSKPAISHPDPRILGHILFVAVQVRPPRTRLLHLLQQHLVSAYNPYHTAATRSNNAGGWGGWAHHHHPTRPRRRGRDEEPTNTAKNLNHCDAVSPSSLPRPPSKSTWRGELRPPRLKEDQSWLEKKKSSKGKTSTRRPKMASWVCSPLSTVEGLNMLHFGWKSLPRLLSRKASLPELLVHSIPNSLLSLFHFAFSFIPSCWISVHKLTDDMSLFLFY